MELALLALCLVSSLAACAIAFLALRAASQPRAPEAHPDVLGRLYMLEQSIERAPRDMRADLTGYRQELKQELVALSTGLQTALGRSEQAQAGHLATLRTEAAQGRKDADEALGRHVTGFSDVQALRLAETNLQMKALGERTEAQLKVMGERIDVLTKEGAAHAELLRDKVNTSLEGLRKGNEEKLDAMRATVDEKLQGVLAERLDGAFKQVSERLDQVHKGLGEMQTLATGVGDLKRVLTNVKSRGAWGEVQLGALLEDLLTPDQFSRQARVRPESAEVVDFVIHLPGQDEKGRVLLPIDCKYPQDDYERLVLAQEAADPVGVEAAGKALERALKVQAKSISDKYVHPPHSTNFAIMYLPTEGLFAEVVRRAAFVQDLQTSCRVTIAGPTTLSALLNSLRMGFTTLEIQKKSSEIGVVLGQTKTAFERYAVALDAVDKALDGAKKKVADVGVRHREIVRRLKGVEAVAIEASATPVLLGLAAPEEDGEESEAA